MFDMAVEELDSAACLAAVEAAHRELMASECRLLVLAAHWADVYVRQPWEGSRLVGGPGTPEVGAFAATELAAVQGMSTISASRLIADALDLRHRLPRLWALVRDGRVRAWKVQKIAQATRHLTAEAASLVDASVAGMINQVPWHRFEQILDAAIIDADPAGAEARAELEEAQRYVHATRSRNGLRTLIARATAGEVAWFLAMTNRIADILLADGDTDAADIRRSKAIGILAQPALALQLLVDHAESDEQPEQTHTDEPADDHRTVRLDSPGARKGLDPARLRPPITLYLHLSELALARGVGVARLEGVGPVTLEQLRRFLGEHACRIRVQPVLNPNDIPAVDAYEIPDRLREAIRLRNPADVFPWGTTISRSTDLDHTIPYVSPDDGGPPGQTSLGNLGPLARSHHRAKTFGGWRHRQPEPGIYLWRSPHGRTYLVTAGGTLPLGHGAFARAVWKAAAPSPGIHSPAA